MRWLILAAGVLAVGCSSVKPLPVVSGERCFRCQRPIDDVKLAGEMIDEGGHAFKFRTAGCMAKYLAEHPGEHYKGLFVTNFSTGKFIPAEDATFTRITLSSVSSEKDYIAFRRAGDAAEMAKKEGGTTVTWDAVLAAANTP
jgi:copper chaperone NosL